MRITFFKTERPKQFNYIPRFYNEEKEEAEKRKIRAMRELGIEQEGEYKHGITHGSMARRFSEKKRANRASVMRLAIIIVILTMLVLYFLSGSVSFRIFH